MTVPLQPVLTSFASPVPAPGVVRFPLRWLLDHASPSLQYRAITEVARLSDVDARSLGALPLADRAALTLALRQRPDGRWGTSMLGVPAAGGGLFEGVGTISAARRLLEYGWEAESAPLMRTRRMLFRLLAEDDDPAFLFELARDAGKDEELVHRGRTILREAAAATLAQAGYESDPRLRGAARRILDRIAGYLRTPLAAKPWVRVGNKQVLAPEAAPPSIFALLMLAHMPLFRNEHHNVLDRLYGYIAQPLPRQEPVQLYASGFVHQPHLVLGDMLPHRNAVDADVPWALFWLELMARLNFLRRNDGWYKLFDRFLDDRTRDGIWHPHKGMEMPRSENPYVWPSFPLEAESEGEARWTDVTFRLGLIARLSGRPIEVV